MKQFLILFFSSGNSIITLQVGKSRPNVEIKIISCSNSFISINE